MLFQPLHFDLGKKFGLRLKPNIKYQFDCLRPDVKHEPAVETVKVIGRAIFQLDNKFT